MGLPLRDSTLTTPLRRRTRPTILALLVFVALVGAAAALPAVEARRRAADDDARQDFAKAAKEWKTASKEWEHAQRKHDDGTLSEKDWRAARAKFERAQKAWFEERDDWDEHEKKVKKPKREKPGKTPPDAPPTSPPLSGDGACRGNGPRTGPGAVVLTFDDGYSSHYYAAQVLERHALCGTFYIPSGWLDDASGDSLTTAEVLTMSRAGQDIQAHSIDHVDLTTLTPTELQRQLLEPKLALEALTGKPVRHLAYPFSAHDAAVHAATASHYATGRAYQSTVEAGTLAFYAPYEIPCLGIEEGTSLATAKGYVDMAKANGITICLAFHDVQMSPPTSYDWSMAHFGPFVDYLASSGVGVLTMSQADDAGHVAR